MHYCFSLQNYFKNCIRSYHPVSELSKWEIMCVSQKLHWLLVMRTDHNNDLNEMEAFVSSYKGSEVWFRAGMTVPWSHSSETQAQSAPSSIIPITGLPSSRGLLSLQWLREPSPHNHILVRKQEAEGENKRRPCQLSFLY